MTSMNIRRMFFDSKTVLKRVDAATRRVFGKFGAYVRTAARSSIRRRKRVSQPGKPPSSHAGHLKRLIYFGYDYRKKSVVIGPTPFRGRAEAPALLEYGGTARRKSKRMRYRPRPFMGPAFEKEKPKLPAMWAGSVK